MSGWETAFVAMSVALGEDAEEARAALGETSSVGTLVSALKAESRVARAQALARELAPIVAAVEKVGIAWR